MITSPPALYTLGHSNRPIGEFLALLTTAGIGTLVDIRAQPYSNRFPHYHTDNLRRALEAGHIAYHWAGRQLGGHRVGRPDSRHIALEPGPLRAFADYMESVDFERGVAQLTKIACQSPTAMLCAEKLPEKCHRGLISDYLTLQGVTVYHLIDPGDTRQHALDARLRRESVLPVYDRLETQSLGLV
jgi:uncharacterized protein (DUF488 family)